MNDLVRENWRVENCRVTGCHRYNIFEEASAEVLRRMQETCEEAFKRSEALGSLMSKAERDEAELEALRKVGSWVRLGCSLRWGVTSLSASCFWS